MPFEIIVVDNNSSDRTADIARELGAKVVFELKPGVCAARQAGTMAAKGQIIVSTDADTTFRQGWIETIWTVFESHPEAVAASSGVHFVGAPWWGHLYTTVIFGLNDWTSRHFGWLFYVSACNLAFRKEYFEGYNTDLTQGGDELDLLRRFKKLGKVIFVPGNETLTSSRRLKKGLVYNLFVTQFVYYFLDYNIGRLTGKSFFGSYIAIREDHIWTLKWRGRLAPVMMGLALAFMSLLLFSHRATAVRAVRGGTSHMLHQLRKEF